jgi:hypothetical protein
LASGNSTPIDFNDNWQDHPSAGTVSNLGLAPSDPQEAALYTCLNPGAYTAQLRGAANTELGVGMFEVIDVDQSESKLVNISSRAEVQEGPQRLVSGFVIQGDEPRTILIRGRGPSVNLKTATIEDPFIELWQGSALRDFNDDWGDATNAAEIIATGKAPADAKESAILMTLEPGAYSVFLRNVTGDPAIGVLEVLDLTEGSVAEVSLTETYE